MIVKKVILGVFMMLAGVLGTAILLATAMSKDWSYSILRILSLYELVPVLIIFVVLAIVGLLLGIWGLFDEKS